MTSFIAHLVTVHAGRRPLAHLDGRLMTAAGVADLAPRLASAAELLMSPGGPITVRETSAWGTNGVIVEGAAFVECRDTITVQTASAGMAPRGLARNP